MLKKGLIIVLGIILVVIIFNKKNTLIIDNNISAEYDTQNYWGTLIIPSINLNLRFYNYDSPLNDVDKNIKMIETGINNTFLIAAHSGISDIAYFNDLYLLKEGDDIYMKFKDNDMHFKVVRNYKVPKSGEIAITSAENKIYLTTCDQIIKGYQIIVEGELVE